MFIRWLRAQSGRVRGADSHGSGSGWTSEWVIFNIFFFLWKQYSFIKDNITHLLLPCQTLNCGTFVSSTCFGWLFNHLINIQLISHWQTCVGRWILYLPWWSPSEDETCQLRIVFLCFFIHVYVCKI